MKDAAAMNNQDVVNFFRYPPLGEEDWSYTYATAQVRVLQAMLLPRTLLSDMTNAPSFEAAVELLSATEYAFSPAEGEAAMEEILLRRRREARKIVCDLIHEDLLVEFVRSRIDFANIRLALRRILTEKPLGTGYSDEGNVTLDQFTQAFEQEDYGSLPGYFQDAVEQGVLAYYVDKKIPHIDYAVDAAEMAYGLEAAQGLKSEFISGLVRLQIDLANIRTMFRLNWAGSQMRNAFIQGGFLDLSYITQGLEATWDVLPELFASTPYAPIIEPSVAYVKQHDSFLRLESLVEGHLLGYLKEAEQIPAGRQPVVAYVFQKEHEIRTIRMILTARKNQLDVRLIRDRLHEIFV